MNADVVIIGAGPAGIFTALEMIKKGSRQKIIMVEKGQAVENRHCPKDKTKKCVNCKPYCHITTGFSGAGAFSDGKLSLSYEVGGDLPTLITPELAQETINYADQIYLDFGADEHIEGLGNDEERKEIRKHAIQAGLKLVDCPIRHMGTEKAQGIYYAIEKGIIIHNPLSEIDYRKFTYKPENNSIMPYTEEERLMILDHLKDEEDLYSLAIRLQFHLTLRIGELKGLRFDDVYGNYIHICRLMNYKNEIEEDIKGHASEGIRWLPLPDEALRIIQKIKDRNPNSPYMFIKDSVTLTTGTYNDHLKKCCTELNIPYRSSHKVRFSTASILYHEGVTLPELQNMLGHTTLAMTTHYIKKISTNDSVLQKVNSVFSKNCMHL